MALKVGTICFVFGLLLVFTPHIRDADAWLAVGIYKSDAHPGKCVISETIILSPGESAKQPGECVRIKCSSEDGMAQLAGCGVIMAPPNCHWGGFIDKDAPYAQCCEQHLICDESANKTEMAQYQSQVHTMLHGSGDPTLIEHALSQK